MGSRAVFARLDLQDAVKTCGAQIAHAGSMTHVSFSSRENSFHLVRTWSVPFRLIQPRHEKPDDNESWINSALTWYHDFIKTTREVTYAGQSPSLIVLGTLSPTAFCKLFLRQVDSATYIWDEKKVQCSQYLLNCRVSCTRWG